MDAQKLHLILADDDADDCFLFREALGQLSYKTALTEFNHGDQLIRWLETHTENLPDALFLDLNMPRKSGFQCLIEIRQNPILKTLPVVIISTSFEKQVADLLYKTGASFYIQKPPDFAKLKTLIQRALSLIVKNGSVQPSKEKFVLTEF